MIKHFRFINTSDRRAPRQALSTSRASQQDRCPKILLDLVSIVMQDNHEYFLCLYYTHYDIYVTMDLMK